MFKENAIKALKRAGYKITKPREWIVEYLDGNTSHPSAIEIYDNLRSQDRSFSFATVYNTLETLVKTGVVQQVTVDPQCSRYDYNTKSHAHFYCKQCGKIEDIFDVNVKLGQEHQMNSIDSYDLNIYGTCKDCISTN
jgi:Fur family peroxide stress response transcriptional regulator